MRFLSHPLVHFLAGGAILFALFEWVQASQQEPANAEREAIHIGPGEVAWLQESFARRWERPATRDEMIELVTTYLKEELLAREARAIGLERDDTLVRRRLAQKLSFLLEDTFRMAQPSDEELRDYFDRHAQRYARGPTISFRHVYFDPEKRNDAEADARAARETVTAAQNDAWLTLGDRLLIEPVVARADEQAVAAQLGEDFAQAVFELPEGQWHGPLASAYGLHLVYIDDVEAPPAEPFELVRARVREDWYRERHSVEVEKYFATLMTKYEVDVAPDVRGMIGPLDELVPQSIGGMEGVE